MVCRHPLEEGDPVLLVWIPACAGMTQDKLQMTMNFKKILGSFINYLKNDLLKQINKAIVKIFECCKD